MNFLNGLESAVVYRSRWGRDTFTDSPHDVEHTVELVADRGAVLRRGDEVVTPSGDTFRVKRVEEHTACSGVGATISATLVSQTAT